MLTYELIQLLFYRFSNIWGKKFLDNFNREESENEWCNEWFSALKDIDVNCIKPALDKCRTVLKWPPSIAEFIEFCDQSSGMPTVDEIMHLAIRRDFSHPMTKIIFDKIGSWDFSHLSEKDLLKKISNLYDKSLEEYKNNLKMIDLNSEKQKRIAE